MHKKSFFKTLFFSLVCLMFCCTALPAWAQLSCNPKTDKCNPVMEAWCIENKETLSKASGQFYTYHNVQCNNKFCCITANKSKGGIPYFLQGILDANNASVDCWLCPLLEKIFVMGNTLSTSIYKTAGGVLLLLDGIFAVLMIAWFAFRVFVDFSGKTARTFIQKQAGLFARLLVVALLLIQPPRTAGKWILDPFISLGSGLGLEIMKNAGSGSAHVDYLAEHMDDQNSVMGCTKQPDSAWQSDQLFAKPSCNALVGLVQIMSIEISTPMQYGQALMSWALGDFSVKSFGKYCGIFFTGLLMVFAFCIILIMTPLKVIDIFVQIAVVGCLLPLAIALFVFPSTRNYTQGVWKMFLSCLIQLIMLSLMVTLAVSMFTGSIDEQVFYNFLVNKNEQAYNAIGLGGTGFLVLVAMAYVAAKLIGKAGAFAQQLGGGVNLGLGEMMSAPVIAATSAGVGFAVGSSKRLLHNAASRAMNTYKFGKPPKKDEKKKEDKKDNKTEIKPETKSDTSGSTSATGTPAVGTPPIGAPAIGVPAMGSSATGASATGETKASKASGLDIKGAPAGTAAATEADKTEGAPADTTKTETDKTEANKKKEDKNKKEEEKKAEEKGGVPAGRKRDLAKAGVAEAGVLALTGVELLMGRSPTDVSSAGAYYEGGNNVGNNTTATTAPQTNNQKPEGEEAGAEAKEPKTESTAGDKKTNTPSSNVDVKTSTSTSSSRTTSADGKVVETVTETKTTTKEITGGGSDGDSSSS